MTTTEDQDEHAVADTTPAAAVPATVRATGTAQNAQNGRAVAPPPGAVPLRPAGAPAAVAAKPAGLNIWDLLHVPNDVQKSAQMIGQVVGTISTAVSWVGTVQSVLQMAGFLSPAPNPFDQLYERLQKDLKTLLTATLAGATEERLRDVAEQGAIARTAAQHANEHILSGRPSDSFSSQRMAIADANSLQVMNVLSDPAWWQRTYDPSEAAVYGPAVPGPTVIGSSELWPVSSWSMRPNAGLIWDYRHVLPVYLRALAARIVVLRARAADANAFQQIAGIELRGYAEFLADQHDIINNSIRVTPAPPAHQGVFPPFIFSCGAVETFTGAHVWGGLHPMYVNPDQPLPTYADNVRVWDQVVADCRRRLYEAIGLGALQQVIRGLGDLLQPPFAVSARTVASASAADIRASGVEPTSHVFTTGADGALHIAWKPNSQQGWQWHNAGPPPGAGLERYHFPVVTGYGDGAGRRIYGFTQGSTNRLYVYYWDGSRWSWSDQGAPEAAVANNATATTFYRQGRQHIRAYAVGTGKLQANWWDGTRWQWVDLGKPALGSYGLEASPAVVTYRWQGRQLDDLYAVAIGRIWEHTWYEDGTRGWNSPSAQPKSQSVTGSPAVVSYERNGQTEVLIFACSDGGGGLFSLQWRNGWQWHEHGVPPGTQIKTDVISHPVKATVLRLPSGQLWRVAVVHGKNGHIYSNLMVTDEGGWNWQDLRTPPGTTVRDLLGINSYVKGGNFVGIDIFVRSEDNRIWRTGIGFDNTWDDMGVPA